MLQDVTLTVQDGALGLSPQNTSQVHVKLGVCSKGATNTLQSFADITTLNTTLGYGPVAEAAAYALSVAGGSIYVVPIEPSTDGEASSVTKVGTGAGTITVGFGPNETITVVCTLGGNNGTAKFTFKIGSGSTSAPVTSTAGATWDYLVPGSLTELTFTQGTGFDAGDTFTIAPTGTITQTVNAGAGTGSISAQASQPFDTYDVKVLIATTGGRGAGGFRYSMDGGNYDIDGQSLDALGNRRTGSYSGEIVIPASTGLYNIPNSGVVITFSNDSFTEDDLHSFLTIAPGFSTSDVTAALTDIYEDSRTWGYLHVVGTPTSAANAATMASTVDTSLTTAASSFRYARGFVECPTEGTIILSGGVPVADTADTDSVVAAAFASSTLPRASYCAGDADVVSALGGGAPLTGRLMRRNAAWVITARVAAIPLGEDPTYFGRGALSGVYQLYRDEGATEALDVARACTLRTYTGESGCYITGVYTLASTTSDYHYFVIARIIDRACVLARSALLRYLGSSQRVYSTGTNAGRIIEQDAQAIEKDVSGKLKRELVDSTPGAASNAGVVVSRTENLLTTSTLPVDVRVVPFGYSRFIEATIGLAVQLAA